MVPPSVGYKNIKTFMVRTTLTCPRYRFFNFMFACVFYNVWRLVHLLVKLSLEVHADYAPRVDANQFVTITKQYYSLDLPTDAEFSPGPRLLSNSSLTLLLFQSNNQGLEYFIEVIGLDLP